ncbi:hypothetical protein [Neobacillus niacini]|uniref:hypothetical protein n=1 Tax=Neobacillus niacini TaxID=86668 RepID=UPI0039831B40
MKKYMVLTFLFIFSVSILSGFQGSTVSPLYGEILEKTPSFFVQSNTKGKDVFVECILSGISFRQSDKKGQKTGKLLIWIDGKKTREVNAAAFIIKDLSPGKHEIKLEVIDLENKSYGLTNKFLVNIPR